MSAIAPPPVGAEAEPSVVSDNACALAALRESLRKSRLPLPRGPRAKVRRPVPPSLAVLFALSAATAIVAIRAKVKVRSMTKSGYRLFNAAKPRAGQDSPTGP